MAPIKKGQNLEQYAMDRARELYKQLVPKSGVWEKSVWEKIFKRIRIEGIFVRECGPAAVATYDLYLSLIAKPYLEVFRDTTKARELVKHCEEDMGRYYGRLAQLNEARMKISGTACLFSQHERYVMNEAAVRIKSTIAHIRRVIIGYA